MPLSAPAGLSPCPASSPARQGLRPTGAALPPAPLSSSELQRAPPLRRRAAPPCSLLRERGFSTAASARDSGRGREWKPRTSLGRRRPPTTHSRHGERRLLFTRPSRGWGMEGGGTHKNWKGRVATVTFLPFNSCLLAAKPKPLPEHCPYPPPPRGPIKLLPGSLVALSAQPTLWSPAKPFLIVSSGHWFLISVVSPPSTITKCVPCPEALCWRISSLSKTTEIKMTGPLPSKTVRRLHICICVCIFAMHTDSVIRENYKVQQRKHPRP